MVFKLVSTCFSIIYSAKKLPTAIAMTFKVFMSGVWHITVGWKIIDKFSKMLYQKNENVLWKARYIKVSILFI